MTNYPSEPQTRQTVQPFDVALGQRLRHVREARGWTQAQLAAAVGLTQDAISLYERGKRSMRVETLVDIARALDVPLSLLLDTHPEVLVIRGTPLAELLRRAAESPDRLRAFREIWEFIDWRHQRPPG